MKKYLFLKTAAVDLFNSLKCKTLTKQYFKSLIFYILTCYACDLLTDETAKEDFASLSSELQCQDGLF